MATTYEKIQSTTLGAPAASITFSTISAAYTDLRLVLVAQSTTGGSAIANARMTLNSDTGTNYSRTSITGDGSSALSNRASNQAFFDLAQANLSSAQPTLLTYDFFSYAGSTFKTVLCCSSQDYNGSGVVENLVYLYRSTTAISTIKIESTINTYATGTIATLYGILKA
jgi:hypothetical protein